MRFTRQPQFPAAIDKSWADRGLVFAMLPGVGHFNLAGGHPLQVSGAMARSAGPAGMTYDSATRSEFPALIDATKGFTLISVWRARTGGDYFGADASRAILSTRTAGNAGWTWGRLSATGGGANGNLTGQELTFQGVSAYAEAVATIEAFIDTPVAVRYNPAAAQISWFRFGRKTQADTTVSAPSAGGNLVFGAQGDYATNGNPWLDRAAVVLAFQGALSDAEILTLTESVSSLWQVFRMPQRRLWAPSSGGLQSYSYTPSGGLSFGGAAPVVRKATKAVSGGLVLAGAAPVSRRASRTVAGGLTLAGAATVIRNATRAPAGGLLLAGTAPYSSTSSTQTRTVTPTGGVVFAGTAPVQRAMRYTPVGGITFGGYAPYSNTAPVAATALYISRRRILRRNFPK